MSLVELIELSAEDGEVSAQTYFKMASAGSSKALAEAISVALALHALFDNARRMGRMPSSNPGRRVWLKDKAKALVAHDRILAGRVKP